MLAATKIKIKIMLPLAEQLQQGDFRAFAGARLSLSLPFSQEMLNQALAQMGAAKDGPLQEIHLEIREANQVEVRLSVQKWGLAKSFGFELHVEPDLGFPGSPRLKLALPSSHALLGSLLELLTSALGLLPGGVAIADRVIEVDLAQAIAGNAPSAQDRARAFLSLIKRGTVETQAGKLILNLQLVVEPPLEVEPPSVPGKYL